MVAYWAIPPLMDCLGLGHAVFSYCGKISLAAMACREMMPDPDFYIECLNESFEEILEASKRFEAASQLPAANADKPKRKRIAKKASSTSHKTATSTAAKTTPVAEAVKPAAAKKPAAKRTARKASSASSKPAKVSEKAAEKPSAAAAETTAV
jgi:hypothetical protein